jgi:uncharacterized protein YbjT (DUF2867 family)
MHESPATPYDADGIPCLGEMGPNLSEHLRSRRQVEEELASCGVPVTTFRAAMIIGSGSASYEILRYLVERLPIMVTPKWVTTECQPVAIADVLHWLVRCLEVLARTIGLLDDLQDRERERSSLVETIFHPVPSVQSRLRGPRATGVTGCWASRARETSFSPACFSVSIRRSSITTHSRSII